MKKKIIWVFGESATGKLTLINNLYNGDDNTLDTFSMKDKKIDVSEITLEDRIVINTIEDPNIYDDSLIEEENLYFNKEKTLKRRSHIMYDVDKFIKSNNDILLIKGQVLDLNIKRGNIFVNFLNKYYGTNNIEIEVFILHVNDQTELRKRIESKPWFKEMDNIEEKERLLSVIPLKQEQHKNDVINALRNYDIPVYFVESLDCSYKIENNVNRKLN